MEIDENEGMDDTDEHGDHQGLEHDEEGLEHDGNWDDFDPTELSEEDMAQYI